MTTRNMNIIITTMMANVAADIDRIAMKDIMVRADDVFSSWGTETPNKYDKETLEDILKKLCQYRRIR